MIWAIFYFQEERFLSSVNLTNLVLQTHRRRSGLGRRRARAAAGRDRPVGRRGERPVRGDHGRAGREAGLVALPGDRGRLCCAGTAIGLFQGSIFTRFGIPSFVVTLAGLLAWPGAQLEVLGETGTVNITDPKITGLTSTFYSDTVGWIFAVVAIAGVRRLRVAWPPAPCGARACRRRRSALVDAADRARGGGRPGRRLGAQRRPRPAARGADPARLRAALLLHHHADDLRPPHLRRGRKRRGGAAGGDPRHSGCAWSCSCSRRPWPRSAGSWPRRACWR